MSATLTPPAVIQPPDSLPVAYLSVSSLNLFARCPEAWKRRYVDKIVDAPSGKMVRGSAAGAALAQHYGRQIETGEGLTTDDVLDEYAGQFTNRTAAEEVVWGTDQPGALKDSGAAALALYHRTIAPSITPVSIEREFTLCWEDAPFVLTGFFDLESIDPETGEEHVDDHKLGKQRLSEDKAKAELQPTVYLAARRAEGRPATFRYHAMAATKTPSAELVDAPRTEHQLDLLTHRVFAVAKAMQWRWLNDCWAGTPPDLAWMCRSCAAVDCAWRLG